jgi:hypothetical protein
MESVGFSSPSAQPASLHFQLHASRSWALNAKEQGDLVTAEDNEDAVTMSMDELPKAALTGVAKEGAQAITTG